MKTLLHETDEISFSLVEYNEEKYAEIKIFRINSRNFLTRMIEEIVRNFVRLFNGSDASGVIVTTTLITESWSITAITAIAAKITALIVDYTTAKQIFDCDFYEDDGYDFSFDWVAIQPSEGSKAVVIYSTDGAIPIGVLINFSK